MHSIAGTGLVVSILAAGVTSALTLAAQTTVTITVIDQPRPVAYAVRQLERRFGYPITYEDTAYLHPDDIVDVTEQVRRDGRKDLRVFGMRNGTIDFSHLPKSGRLDARVAELLDEVITHSRRAGNTGDYRIERRPGRFHVVPIATRGTSGAMEGYASPLEARVTVATVEDLRTMDAITRFGEVVSAASGQKLEIGMVPTNLFMQTRVRLEARDEPARDVIWRMLRGLPRPLSWQLLCGVQNQGCALNIHFVPTIP